MNDPVLVSRALVACDLLAAAYAGTLADHGEVIGTLPRWGLDAALLRRRDDGLLWLILPGSGDWRDWLRNLASLLPARWRRRAGQATVDTLAHVPARGDSGRLWSLGFLWGARKVRRWLKRRGYRPDVGAGHSAGASILAIMAWSGDVPEAHAVAPARVRFGPPEPVEGLHTWTAADDLVGSVPIGASHCGTVHRLPASAGRHSVESYRERLGWK